MIYNGRGNEAFFITIEVGIFVFVFFITAMIELIFVYYFGNPRIVIFYYIPSICSQF